MSTDGPRPEPALAGVHAREVWHELDKAREAARNLVHDLRAKANTARRTADEFDRAAAHQHEMAMTYDRTMRWVEAQHRFEKLEEISGATYRR